MAAMDILRQAAADLGADIDDEEVHRATPRWGNPEEALFKVLSENLKSPVPLRRLVDILNTIFDCGAFHEETDRRRVQFHIRALRKLVGDTKGRPWLIICIRKGTNDEFPDGAYILTRRVIR